MEQLFKNSYAITALFTLLLMIPLRAMQHAENIPNAAYVRQSRWDKRNPVPLTIYDAARTGDEHVMATHIAQKVDLNRVSTRGEFPILLAIKHEHPQMVPQLLSAGANPLCQDNLCRTPLIWAAYRGDVTSINYVLAAIDDAQERLNYLNYQDIGGKTALTWAAFYGHAHAIETLILAGTDTCIRDHKGKLPRTWAAYNGHDNAVATFLRYPGYDCPDKKNRTALSYAAAHGFSTITARLIGAIDRSCYVPYINHQDYKGQTPLFLAARYNHVDTIHTLRTLGAWDVPDYWTGRNALSLQTERNNAAVVDALTIHGVQDTPDESGKTALSRASEHGHTYIAKLLLARGAHDVPDYTGKTALTWAIEKKQSGTKRVLSEYWRTMAGTVLQRALGYVPMPAHPEQEADTEVKKRRTQE